MLIIYRSFNAMEKLRRHVWRVVRKFWRASEFDECVFEFEVHRAVKRLCISKCLRTPGNSFLSSQHALSTDLSYKISVLINDEILRGFEQLSPSFVVIMHLLVTNALNFTKSVAADGNCVI